MVFLSVVTTTAYSYSDINQQAPKTITDRFGNIVKTTTIRHEHPMHEAAHIITDHNGG